MAKHIVVVQSSLLRIRRTTEDDLDFVLSAERDQENSPFVRQWSREQHLNALETADLAHLICETANDVIVGFVLLDEKNVDQSLGLKRIVITDKGRGYGRETLRLIKKLAFEELQAHRLWLDVKEHNHRARHVYEAEGFVIEGTLRECLKAEAGFESLVVMSMLRHEYQQNVSPYLGIVN